MKTKIISVIVPIYNAEKYLNKCLDSIINQSYENLEIILVNDGSTDASSRIINEYAAKDKRIKTLHKVNGGIGSAYAVAFANATGDYFSFVDSDDYIVLNMYEELIKIVIDKEPDIIHFGYDFINEKGDTIQSNKTSNEIIEGNDKILQRHFTYFKDPSLACRLFKRNLFDKITMFDQNIGIDEIAIVQLLTKSSRVVHISKTFYYAYVRSNSVSRIQYSERKIGEGIRVHQFICNHMDKFNPKFSPYLDIKYLNYLVAVYDTTRLNKDFRKRGVLNQLMSDFVNYYHKAKGKKEFKIESLQFKTKIYTLNIFPPLYPYVSSLLLYYNRVKKIMSM